ncbi:MAG: putative dsRNA-binding protein, partial [Polyangiales bacterium]
LHTSAPGHRDAKSRAQEWAQAHLGGTPSYRLLETDGPDHDREFTVALELNDEAVATGAGRSKIEAEQAAAEVALDVWAAQAMEDQAASQEGEAG